MRLLAALLVLLLSFDFAIAGPIIRKPKSPKKNVYVLTIGFSPTGRYHSTAMFRPASCPTCLTDATGMAAYFRQLAEKKAPYVDSVFTWTYTSDINLDTLYRAFGRIQQRISKDDVFIFYYATTAWNYQRDAQNNEEGYYVLSHRKFTEPQNENYSFTLRHLKMLTDRISANAQMIILDTGDGRVILPDYYRNFFSDNLADAVFTKKNRVIFCPEKLSSESDDLITKTKKGDLFKVISNLPDSFNVLAVFDTLNRKAHKSFLRHWYNNQVDLMGHLKIIQEADYLKLLASLKLEGDGKRGLTLTKAAVTVDNNMASRSKKAIIVATNHYQGALTWKPLRNPVNDGRDAAEVLQGLGYEVTTLYNKPKDSILSAISHLIDNEVQNPYSQYIIYFAGHGFYDPRQKAGYIVCSDSRELKDLQRPTMTELNTYIDYTVLFRNLDQLNKVILVTDVCFGGTSVNSLLQWKREADPQGEQSRLKNPFKKVLASGIREVDDFIRLHDGSVSNNSPFAAALLDLLKKEGRNLSFEELYARLKNNKTLNPTPLESSFGTEVIPNTFSF